MVTSLIRSIEFLFLQEVAFNTRAQVPNVKLRPAEKGTVPRPTFEDCWAQETQLGSDDTMLLDRCPRPFKGIVICATGIPDKVRGAYFHKC